MRFEKRRERFLLPVVLLGTIFETATTSAQSYDPSFYADDRVPELTLVFAMDDWLARLRENYQNGNTEYVPAELIFEGVTYPDVGVQHKGDASYTGARRENLKITMDAFVPGQDLLGYDIITLDAGRQTSIFTEVAALFLLEDYLVTPDVNLAHLVIGTAANPFDVGVFTNTERVDTRFIRRRFGDEGHRYSPKPVFRDCEAFDYQGDLPADYVRCYYAQGGDATTEYEDIAAAAIALHNASDAEIRASVSPFIDLDPTMRSLIGNRMCGNFDSLIQGNNYFIVEKTLDHSQMVPVVWDLDLAWEDYHPDPIPEEDDEPVARILRGPHQLERAHTYVRHYLRGSFAEGVLDTHLQNLKALVLDKILGSPHSDLKTEADVDAAIAYCTEPVRRLRDELNANPEYQRELPTISSLGHTPEDPMSGQAVWVTVSPQYATSTVSEVLLWNRVRGNFVSTPMIDDGAHEDGAANDGVYGARLMDAVAGDVVEYYVEVRPTILFNASYGFEPWETVHRPRQVRIGIPDNGTLFLNEFVADNENGDEDEAMDHDDWLEIINTSTIDRDIGGYQLTDDPNERGKWAFPNGTLVPAGGHIRVWADNEPAEGPLHANFRLSKDGERLLLSAPAALGGDLLDEVTFGAQEQDVSFGRVPDGGQHWFFIQRPSGEGSVVSAGEWNAFDARRLGSPSGLTLSMSGSLKVGQMVQVEIQGGTPGSSALLLLSTAVSQYDLGARGILALDPTSLFMVQLSLDGNGQWTLPIQVPTVASDLTFYAQVLNVDLSNAIMAWVEP